GTSTTTTSTTTAPWYAIFPDPLSTPQAITPEGLATLLRHNAVTLGKDFLIIDVRRVDFEVACIRGAINLPAHSFYQTLPGIIAVISHVPKVIFHCNSCKAGGRGPRTAAWYADELKKHGKGDQADNVFVLEGGMKAWVSAYGGDENLTTKLPHLSSSS
ncbi:hypothetical protein FRB90_003999, partial [Tulasnella sp. 427]